jgi:hypothetical protein
MSKLSQLKNSDTDRSKINKWLDKINEKDQAIRDEVLDNCAKDIESRKYYVKRYEQDCIK